MNYYIISYVRLEEDEKQTIGKGFIYDSETFDPVFEFDGLELPWKNNEKRVSRIPEGSYDVIKHISPSFGQCFWIQNVPNRSEILIHKGNFNRDTKGCLIAGNGVQDIDKDGSKDVVNSAKTIEKMLSLIPDSAKIKIVITDEFVTKSI